MLFLNTHCTYISITSNCSTYFAQKPNEAGVRVLTWYSQMHHFHKGHFSALSSKQGTDVGTTAQVARNIIEKAGVVISGLERALSNGGGSNGGAIWDVGGLRVEVRAEVMGSADHPLTVHDIQQQLGPWLALTSQQAMLQKYIDCHSAGTISIRKLEFSTDIVLRQANIAMFLLTKCLDGKPARAQLTQKAKFVLLFLASCIGYSNPRWYASFLTLAARSDERRILKQVYEAIYSKLSNVPTPALCLFPQSAEQVCTHAPLYIYNTIYLHK